LCGVHDDEQVLGAKSVEEIGARGFGGLDPRSGQFHGRHRLCHEQSRLIVAAEPAPAPDHLYDTAISLRRLFCGTIALETVSSLPH
jgi:hypothetical protein